MNVLVFNCGSSSLKYKIIAMPGEQELAGGAAERVGPKTSEPSRIVHRHNGKTEIIQVEMRNHHESFLEIMKLLSKYPDLIPDAVGHRVVHGGKYFTGPVISNDAVMEKLEEIKDLAPAQPVGPPPMPPASLFAPRVTAAPLNLPTFNNLMPGNPGAMAQHLEQVAYQSNLAAALKSLGIIKDE